jgi:transcriptional regulator with XRE-family HTH domain
VRYSQIGHYEEKDAQPSADILAKLANALEVSSDYLMNGTTDELANSSLTDKELLSQFQKVSLLSNDRTAVVKELLEAFLLKSDLQQKFAR